ncbi:MAG: alpha/beta hydrolase [Marmoricola sp.]|nr:alpha/beta hydrolase [Marmoricola sp.]
MLRRDPKVAWGPAFQARAFQAVFPMVFRIQSSPRTYFNTKKIEPPTKVLVPTRHGDVPTLVYAPTAATIEDAARAGRRPPAHLITHGGAFIIRVPEQEDNVAQYLASSVGCYVVIPDYDSAPQVCFPVAEEQTYDVFRWMHESGSAEGWDVERISVGGPSAGGKYAVSVVTQAIDDGYHLPVALTAEYGCVDFVRSDTDRTSTAKRPVVPPALMKLVRNTYFVGADVHDPLVSPFHYERLEDFPPTLILTAELDTLRREMTEFADKLANVGVDVTYREFAGVDHGFTHAKPVAVAREAIMMIGDHLKKAYA